MNLINKKLSHIMAGCMIMNGALGGVLMSFPYLYKNTGGIYSILFLHTVDK